MSEPDDEPRNAARSARRPAESRRLRAIVGLVIAGLGLGALAWWVVDGMPEADSGLDAVPDAYVPAPVVLAPFGERYVFPAVVVERDGDDAQVVFADGDVRTVSARALVPDIVVPGVCLGVRGRDRRPHRGCVLTRVHFAVEVHVEGGGTEWTSLPHLFADPRLRTSEVEAYVPAPAEVGERGSLVLVDFRGEGLFYVAAVVAREDEAEGDRRFVVYADGDSEWVELARIRPFVVREGVRVQAAPRQTEAIDLDAGEGTLVGQVGGAMHLLFDDGRDAWVAVANVRIAPDQL